MSLDPLLLELLVCPETRSPLTLASPELLKQLNTAIGKGRIENRAGKRVTEKLDAALVRQDNAVAYAVRDDVPVMLIDEQLALSQVR